MSMKRKSSQKSLANRMDHGTTDDFLLVSTLRVPCPYGIVLLPEPIGNFANGDVVRYTGGKEMLAPEEGEDGGRGRLMKVAAGDCQKVRDPKIAQSLRLVILRPWSGPSREE